MASLAISFAVGASQHEIDARAKAAEERAQQQASKQALRDEKEAEVSRIEMLQLPPGSHARRCCDRTARRLAARAATADEGPIII